MALIENPDDTHSTGDAPLDSNYGDHKPAEDPQRLPPSRWTVRAMGFKRLWIISGMGYDRFYCSD